MKTRLKTDYIVIHCSATRPSQDIGATDIDTWHRTRGFNGIGYHYVIRRDGTVEKGRDITVSGAHVEGYNHNSVGVCLVGGVDEEDFRVPENNFTAKQWATLEILIRDMKKKYPRAAIVGHTQLNPLKACPSFDVKDWLKGKVFT